MTDRDTESVGESVKVVAGGTVPERHTCARCGELMYYRRDDGTMFCPSVPCALWLIDVPIPVPVPQPDPQGGETLPSVGGESMERSVADFVRACRVQIGVEQQSHFPNTALIGLLCDAVRYTRETERDVMEPDAAPLKPLYQAIGEDAVALMWERDALVHVLGRSCRYCRDGNRAKPNQNGYLWHEFDTGDWSSCELQIVGVDGPHTCVSRTSKTCIWLADGTKVVAKRDPASSGRMWLEVTDQARIVPADALPEVEPPSQAGEPRPFRPEEHGGFPADARAEEVANQLAAAVSKRFGVSSIAAREVIRPIVAAALKDVPRG